MLDLVRFDADGLEAFGHRANDLTAATLRDVVIEPRVDDDRALGAHDRPYVVVERHWSVVLVAAQKVEPRGTIEVSVADGQDFVGSVHEQERYCRCRIGPQRPGGWSISCSGRQASSGPRAKWLVRRRGGHPGADPAGFPARPALD